MARIEVSKISERGQKCQWCGEVIEMNFPSYVVYDTEKKCYWHDTCHPTNFEKAKNGWC